MTPIFIRVGQDRVNVAHIVSMRPMTDSELANRRFRVGTKVTTVNDEVFWADRDLPYIFDKIEGACGVHVHC